MTITERQNPEISAARVKNVDLTGQHRFRRNVVFAWGGYLVNIVAGFIMPRLISDRLGQTTLGVWDFAWSVVSYFGLVQLGLSGSVQRYVARYRASGESQQLSESVSTIGLSLTLSSAAALILTLVGALWIVPQFGARLGEATDTARMVVLWLGFEVSFSILLTVYGGILVGCHRWDAHNTISAVSYALMTLGMISALIAGGGLASLAAIHCLSMSGAEIVRWRLARRVCPEFVMDYRMATWKTWMEQARFSAKSLLPRIADLISNQSLSILITAYLGPAMLAIYCRPRNLMGQGRTLAAKFGSILIPTSSSLQARADHAQLQATFLNSASFLAMMTMPALATMIVFGDELLRLWMGPGYNYIGLIPILGVAAFPSLIQEPVWSILSGMNCHGKLAIYKLLFSICAAAALWIGLTFFHWKLVGAALAFAIPTLILDSTIAPIIACRRLKTPPSLYYSAIYLKPMLGTAVIVLFEEITRRTWQTSAATAAICGLLALTAIGWMYWLAFAGLKTSVAGQAVTNLDEVAQPSSVE